MSFFERYYTEYLMHDAFGSKSIDKRKYEANYFFRVGKEVGEKNLNNYKDHVKIQREYIEFLKEKIEILKKTKTLV